MFGLILYQVLFLILSILLILIGIKFYKDKKLSTHTCLLWILLWILVIIFDLLPNTTSFLAHLFGLGRGLDILLILGIFGAFYLIFRLYLKIDALNQNINKLVTQIAISNENKYEDNHDVNLENSYKNNQKIRKNQKDKEKKI
jgi:hypothetical protein